MPRSQSLAAGRHRQRYLCMVLVMFAGLTLGPVARAQEALTLKERLSDKASDEQRIDNCRVPPERRGARPRPECADRAAAPTQAADQGR
jgi:hypothetical protein